jgi:hypothetical protein
LPGRRAIAKHKDGRSSSNGKIRNRAYKETVEYPSHLERSLP